jgi:hypothetical protein
LTQGEGLLSLQFRLELFVFGLKVVQLVLELSGLGVHFETDFFSLFGFEFLELAVELVDFELGGSVEFLDLFPELLVELFELLELFHFLFHLGKEGFLGRLVLQLPSHFLHLFVLALEQQVQF